MPEHDVIAEEATHRQQDPDKTASHRRIGQGPAIARIHPKRRLRADGTYTLDTTDPGGEQHVNAGAQLVDLDACEVRKKLFDGITQPDNDSSSAAHHTIRARAEIGRQMFASSPPRCGHRVPRDVRENRHHSWILTASGAGGSSRARSPSVQMIMNPPGCGVRGSAEMSAGRLLYSLTPSEDR